MAVEGKKGAQNLQLHGRARRYKKARKRPKVLTSTKRSACGRIFSVPAFDLQPARVYIIPALKRVGVVQTPRQGEKELYRCLFIPFRSSFWPCKYPLMNKTSGSSHHDLDNKWGGELWINSNSKTSQRRCFFVPVFFAVPVLSHPFWPGASIKTSRLDRTSDHCSNQKSAQADWNKGQSL